jgi:hypothetical protein
VTARLGVEREQMAPAWSASRKVRWRNALDGTGSRTDESHVTWNPTSQRQPNLIFRVARDPDSVGRANLPAAQS